MTWRAWIAFAALCVIWGIPYFFIKQALHDLAPACVAWGRIAIGAAVLLPIAWKRGALKDLRSHKGAILGFAFAELIGPFYVIALGERWISSSLTGILLACVPLTVVMLSPLFGVKERLGARRLLGLATGLVGVVVLLGIDTPHNLNEWLGVVCILAAVVGYATGPLVVQRFLGGADPLGMVAASLAVGTLVLALPAALAAPTALPSLQAMLSIVVLGLVCTSTGLLLFVFLIGEAGAARAAVVTYINPAVAVLLGVLLLNEDFGAGSAAGLLLILLGSWLATGGARAQPEAQTPQPSRTPVRR
jgi:drug/metabolite transporter (DMT)-like permease